MKASKFSEAQIEFVLKQAEDGTAVAEVCRKGVLPKPHFITGASAMPGWCPPR